MSKIKSLFFIITVILIFATVITPVFAHSGKTDANGGHYDTATGEYHYHHGYPAHQHTNGKCPYDYDDKTNHQSGTGSSTASSEGSTPNIFSLILSFIIWGLIFGVLELCLLPLFSKIKDEQLHKIVIGISIALWIVAAIFLAIIQPFF